MRPRQRTGRLRRLAESNNPQGVRNLAAQRSRGMAGGQGKILVGWSPPAGGAEPRCQVSRNGEGAMMNWRIHPKGMAWPGTATSARHRRTRYDDARLSGHGSRRLQNRREARQTVRQAGIWCRVGFSRVQDRIRSSPPDPPGSLLRSGRGKPRVPGQADVEGSSEHASLMVCSTGSDKTEPAATTVTRMGGDGGFWPPASSRNAR
jgi:hypothetical protein